MSWVGRRRVSDKYSERGAIATLSSLVLSVAKNQEANGGDSDREHPYKC